jgi:hypothetical protein
MYDSGEKIVASPLIWRLSTLSEREKTDQLSAEEKAELDHFVEFEHTLRMAKARARQILTRGR